MEQQEWSIRSNSRTLLNSLYSVNKKSELKYKFVKPKLKKKLTGENVKDIQYTVCNNYDFIGDGIFAEVNNAFYYF